MFSKVKRNQENLDPNSSQIVRHDAFFAKMIPKKHLKASDIQHTVELSLVKEDEEKVCDKVDSPGAESDKTGAISLTLSNQVTSRNGQPDGEDNKEPDSTSLRSVFRKNKINLEVRLSVEGESLICRNGQPKAFPII